MRILRKSLPPPPKKKKKKKKKSLYVSQIAPWYEAHFRVFCPIFLKTHQIICQKSQKSQKRAQCYSRNLSKIDFLGIFYLKFLL